MLAANNSMRRAAYVQGICKNTMAALWRHLRVKAALLRRMRHRLRRVYQRAPPLWHGA